MAKKRIKDLNITATASDLKAGNHFVIDGAEGTKKLPAEILKEVKDNASFVYGFTPVFNPSVTYRPGDVVLHEGKRYMFHTSRQGSWNTGFVIELNVKDVFVNLVSFTLPAFDSSQKTLTIKSGTRVVINGRVLDLFSEDLVVQWHNTNVTVNYVVYDIDAKTIKMIQYTTHVPPKNVIIGSINRSGFNSNSWLIGGLSYDGVSLGRIASKVTTLETSVSTLETSVPALETDVSKRQHKVQFEVFSPSVFNSSDLTLKIKGDLRVNYGGSVIKPLDGADTTISWPTGQTNYSLMNVVYNLVSHAFSMQRYDAPLTANQVVFGVLYRVIDNGASWCYGGLVYDGYGYLAEKNKVATLETSVATLETSVSTLKGDSHKLAAMWANKVEHVKTLQGKNFTFAIETDTHFIKEPAGGFTSPNDIGWNFGLLPQYIGIDFFGLLGDIIQGYNLRTHAEALEDYTEFMHRCLGIGNFKILPAIGNHDRNADASDITDSELYSYVMKPTNHNRNAVYGATGLYYYEDFDTIRVITLYTNDGGFAIGSAQLDWLETIALDTNKDVLIMSHVPLVEKIDGVNDHNNTAAIRAVLPVLKAFIDGGGTIIACVCGHTHWRGAKVYQGITHISCYYAEHSDCCEIFIVNQEEKTITGVFVGNNASYVDRSYSY